MNRTRKITTLSILTALAMILSIVENMVPINIGLPGIKLGLANLVTIFVLSFYGFYSALVVVTIRCLLVSLAFGGPTLFAFSITGGILSILVMNLLIKLNRSTMSIKGISIAGAVSHNIGQLIIAIIILNEIKIYTYIPVLIISGIITGIIIGILSEMLIKSFKKSMII
jgi:heptaprenyl diphosphate synthase